MLTKNLKSLPIVLAAAFYFLFFSFNSTAQSVGINNTGAAPDNSALLDLNSTDKGFLITRVETTDISSPAFGLMTLAPSDSCLYLFNGIDWIGMGGAGYNCTCGISGGTPPDCGLPITDARDGKEYKTVEIGNQCWLAENLNYETSSGDYWCYDNDPSHCNTYGKLYDWNGAMDGSSSSPNNVQGSCPVGWHLPSDAEWKELEMHLGMSQVDADLLMWRGSIGGDIKSSTNWDGNNSSGFTGLPGGAWFPGIPPAGAFRYVTTGGGWWSATAGSTGNEAITRYVESGNLEIRRASSGKTNGSHVRCVKD